MRRLVIKFEKTIMILLFINIIFQNSISYAVTYSKGAIEMQTDKNEISIGDTFTISILIPMTMSSSNRRSIKEADVTLNYDPNVIECIEANKIEYNLPTSLTKKEGKIEYTLEPYSVYALGNGSVLFTVKFKVISDDNIDLNLLYDAVEGTTSQKFTNEQRNLHIKNNVKLNSISLNKEKLDMIEGEQESLQVIYNPANTTDKKDIIWSSANKDVVEINNNGVIKAISEGTTIITADCNGKKAICEVNVLKLSIPLDNISIGKDITIEKGKKHKLEVIYNPENTTVNKSVRWESSNNDIVYVDQNGIITAKSEGISTITATVDNKQAKILVSVFSNDRGENNIIENNIQKNIIHEDNGSDNINLSSNSILDEEPKTGTIKKNISKSVIYILVTTALGFILYTKIKYK